MRSAAIRSVLAFTCSSVLLIGCNDSNPLAPGPTAPLNQSFTLAPGESTNVEAAAMRVTFRSVVRDSRCPADVLCVWAGEAVLAFDVRRTDADGSSHQLTTTPSKSAAMIGSYRLELEQVTPYRFVSIPIEPEDYRATLRVSSAR